MQELEPWVLLHGEDPPSLALWRVAGSRELAVALFSNSGKADAYIQQGHLTNPQTLQPNRLELVGLLAEAFRQGICWAALDPTADHATKLYDLRSVLKAARTELQLAATRDPSRTSFPGKDAGEPG